METSAHRTRRLKEIPVVLNPCHQNGESRVSIPQLKVRDNPILQISIFAFAAVMPRYPSVANTGYSHQNA
jgi:hypothetical protein